MEAENSVTDLLKKYIEVQTQLKLVQTAIFMKDSKDKIAKKTHDMMEFAENQADELLKKGKDAIGEARKGLNDKVQDAKQGISDKIQDTKQGISDRITSTKEYANEQVKVYMEARAAIDDYKASVEAVNKEYDESFKTMFVSRELLEEEEVENIGQQGNLIKGIKETRKTEEYKSWKKEVKAKSQEIKRNSTNPEALITLAEELEELKAQDPTLKDRKELENLKGRLEEIRDAKEENDSKIQDLKADKDKELDDLLETKNTSLDKIGRQNIWQKIVARFVPKTKKFKTQVVDKIVDKAKYIKNEKLPEIKDKNAKARKERRDKVIDVLDNAQQFVSDRFDDLTKKAIPAVLQAGKDTKDKAVKGIRDIGKKIIDAKDNAKEFVTGKLQQGIKNATGKLQDFADADGR